MQGQGVLVAMGLILLSAAGFFVYFVFKILEFVLQAIKLYKKMILQQNSMMHILIDIRDNTKKYSPNDSISEPIDLPSDPGFEIKNICEVCKAEVPAKAKFCTSCGSQFE